MNARLDARDQRFLPLKALKLPDAKAGENDDADERKDARQKECAAARASGIAGDAAPIRGSPLRGSPRHKRR
jgi:hypothetical protein